MKIKFLFFIFLILSFSQVSFSQVYDYKNATKSHFRVVNIESYSNPDFLQQAAYEFSGFDSLRLVNQRRVILVKGTQVYIELYSGQELLEMYGKEISPLNLSSNADVTNYQFVFVESKAPIFTIEKVN